MPEKPTASEAFKVVDYFLDNISDNAIECGAYYNSPSNGDERMVKSFKEILWALYEELEGNVPQPAGPFVYIDPINGISISKRRK